MADTCPKCQSPRDKASASCPKCGIAFHKFDAAVLEEGVTPELKQHWAQVRENWTDQSAHAAFVEAALASGACGFAARCYSSYGTDKIARANLDRIAARLMIMLENSAARTSGHRSRRLIIGILVLVLVLVGLTVFFLHFAP